MVTYTAPEQIRRFIPSNQRVAYGAASRFLRSPEKVCSRFQVPGRRSGGFFGVLDTGGRRKREYHLPSHCIAVGGALSSDGGLWLPSGNNFYVPVEAQSTIFRAKF